MPLPRVKTALVAASFLWSTSGCIATVQPDYVVATSVPPNIVAYPYAYYGGRNVYLVNDRWYYQRGNSWVYYRQVPPDLYRQRTTIIRQRPYVQSAPPAYGPYRYGPPVRQGAPAYVQPQRQYAPPQRYSAPPATRVR